MILRLLAGCASDRLPPLVIDPPSPDTLTQQLTDTGSEAPSHTTVTALPAGTPACTEPSDTWLADRTACAGLSGALHVLAPAGPSPWYATGQAWADFDGDTWLDLVVTSWDGANTRVYLGSQQGLFTPGVEPGLAGTPSSGATVADVDADGRPDVFLAGRADDWLLLNDGVQLQRAPGGPSSPGLGQGGAFADLDGDGVLELFVANYVCPECGTEPSACASAADALFVQGPGGWTDVAEQALGRDGERCGLAFMGSFADFDGDGDLDLYVANDKGVDGPDLPDTTLQRNAYFRNDGPGCGAVCFDEIARENGSDLRIDSMGLEIGDLDDDGDLDLLVSDGGPTRLLLNDGLGGFTDATEGWSLQVGAPEIGWGLALLDLENDGDLDLFTAATGRDRLHLNVGGAFEEVSALGVPEDLRTSYGVAAADYDRDGMVDLIVGDVGWGYRLLRNTRRTEGAWLGLRLSGYGPGGTDAIGARVWVTDSSGRTQLREVRSGISNGAGGDLGVHFGLGPHDLTEVRVRWPDGVEELLTPEVNAWSVVRRGFTPAGRTGP